MVHKAYISMLLLALSCTGLIHVQSAPASTRPQPLEAKVDMAGIKGTFLFTPLKHSDTGATVRIHIQSGLTKQFAVLPTVGFEYHIHLEPVGPGGDCAATLGHLDPANVGEGKCDPAVPEKCQEGDLSGKHGNLLPTKSGAISTIKYVDHQLAFKGAKTTIAGRSIVIHNNGTRIACANILPVGTARQKTGSDSGSQKEEST
ncbi:hypothetical protein BC939DRAFT_480908 [Gamsiella multidivaricata]|uniref:uncharacterized protein n=1 Tax=Gamsiella multidivaricata TaxID=101098 RepID=UPI0022210CBD|nr:uncharacterized protein BC939DRAFT_480908 [Gamsiella multidivaricata]KAI7817771.1 hypothetical protein BC939DRAFT_480908 [Gamsiella multidivaricata]